jgi:hypothetical protein
MAIPRWCTGTALFVGLLLVGVSGALAFETYTSDGCGNSQCHGSFKSTTTTKTENTWPDDKHNVHREVMMVKDAVDGVNPDSCVFCHIRSPNVNNNPVLNESDGDPAFNIPGLGCVGCHGQPIEVSPGVFSSLGAGLRAHHAAKGQTFCGDAGCHDSDPTPLPESTQPEYYGLPGVNITSPCLAKGTPVNGSENFTSDALGLDNDGDDQYEAADSDCSVSAPDINLDPSMLAFASVAIADSKDLMTQVQNLGTADLNVTSISLCAGTSSEFSWSPVGPFTVAAAGNQVLTVTYAPVDEGQDSGCLSISSNDPDEDPIELTVSGEGVVCLPDLIFAGEVIDQVEEIVACSSITLGPNTQIIQGNFRAGELVEFIGDVDAQLMTITLDPALLPPP